jgi:REP element-mobilizing transposase RayT
MSELRKANTPGIPYFITMTVIGWIDLFTRREINNIIIKNLRYAQNYRGLEIFAYVIMYSHIHMIARKINGNLNDIIRDFKSYSAKEIIDFIQNDPTESRKQWLLGLMSLFASTHKQNKNLMLWQKTNYPIPVEDNNLIDQKIEYIIYNPVKAGIVLNPEDYYYSSANPFSPLKVCEV